MTSSLKRTLAPNVTAAPHGEARRAWGRVRLAALAVAGVDTAWGRCLVASTEGRALPARERPRDD